MRYAQILSSFRARCARKHRSLFAQASQSSLTRNDSIFDLIKLLLHLLPVDDRLHEPSPVGEGGPLAVDEVSIVYRG